MIRVCPERDAVCPHGMDCPYVLDRYECKPEPRPETPPMANPQRHAEEVG
jgi:hypothetical protein